MLADKTGLRKRDQAPVSKVKSKYTQEDLSNSNRMAGIDLLRKLDKQGLLTEEEKADLIRQELKLNNNGR
ncbi:hypothetical protein PF672P1_00055 [Parabacteroides phage PF672P1]|nr:hypothetical protein PF672P1_00055 [Parabacteroides phage PF672P1]